MKTISELCRIVGVTRRTLQEYAEPNVGLLLPSAKTEGGYWLYDDEAVATLMIIQLFRAAGYKRKEIKEVLQKIEDGTMTISASVERVRERLEVERKRLDGMINYLNSIHSTHGKPYTETQVELGKVIMDKGIGNASFNDLMERMFNAEDYDEVPEEYSDISERLAMHIISIVSSSNEDPASDVVQMDMQNLYDEYLNMIIAIVRKEEDVSEEEIEEFVKEIEPEGIKEMLLEMVRDPQNLIIGEEGREFFTMVINAFFSRKQMSADEERRNHGN